MRSSYGIALLIAVIFGTGYWYYTAEAVCKVPIEYTIGTIDPRFNITQEDVESLVFQAESVWEDATGRNLFSYEDGADLTVNFVYDDRQENSRAEHNLRDVLTTKEWRSDAIRQEYEDLVDEYEDLQETYEERRTRYETRLQAHNAEVERWNEAGGAPEDIYANLTMHQNELAAEQKALNSFAAQLNTLVQEINRLGEQGNSVISDYNKTVEEYNDRFHEHDEFAQGDYQGDSINIYQYDSEEELLLVLAHELGHALHLGHVEGEQSILYYLMESQDVGSGPSEEDLAEFNRVCGESTLTKWLKRTPLRTN